MLLIIDKPPEIKMKCFVYLYFLVLMIPVFADVTIRDMTITWHTFDYTLAEDYTLESWTDTPYDTVSHSQKIMKKLIYTRRYPIRKDNHLLMITNSVPEISDWIKTIQIHLTQVRR